MPETNLIKLNFAEEHKKNDLWDIIMAGHPRSAEVIDSVKKLLKRPDLRKLLINKLSKVTDEEVDLICFLLEIADARALADQIVPFVPKLSYYCRWRIKLTLKQYGVAGDLMPLFKPIEEKHFGAKISTLKTLLDVLDLGEPVAGEQLKQMLQQPLIIQGVMLEFAGYFPDDRVIPMLITFSKVEDRGMQLKAIELLGMRHTATAFQRLEELWVINNTEVKYRKALLTAIRRHVFSNKSQWREEYLPFV